MTPDLKLRILISVLFAALLSALSYVIDQSGTFYALNLLTEIVIAEAVISASPILIFLLPARINVGAASVSILMYSISVLILFGTVFFIPAMILFAVILAVYSRMHGPRDLSIIAISVVVFYFMILVSGIMRVGAAGLPNTILFFSIYDDILPVGVPLLFSGGIVIQAQFFVYTFSFATMIIYSVISVLIAVNYVLIYRTYTGRDAQISSILSGAAVILGCQCEGITGILPSFAALLVSVIVLPLLIESVLLVLLTAFTLYSIRRGRRLSFFLPRGYIHEDRRLFSLAAVILLAIPVFETVGIYLGYLDQEAFFFGVNFLMFAEGFLLVLIAVRSLHLDLRYRGTLIPLLLLSILMFVWYLPELVSLASSHASYYILMNICAVISGSIAAWLFSVKREKSRVLLLEYISMMFSMTGIAILYATAYSILVWREFTFASQTTFSILTVVISLPIMWYITNRSLVENAHKTSFTVSVHNN